MYVCVCVCVCTRVMREKEGCWRRRQRTNKLSKKCWDTKL